MSANSDGYKCGLAYLALIVFAPVPMAVSWIVRFVTGGPWSRVIANILSGVLSVVAIVKGLENPALLMPGTTAGLFFGQTAEQVMRTLQTPRGMEAVLWLVPVAYAFQEILARIMNPELTLPKTKEDNRDSRRVVCSGEQDVSKGVLIGATSGGREAYITPEELNRHVALIGTTGSGKTMTLYNFIEYNALKGQACIIIDGKGDRDFLEAAKAVCAQCGQYPALFAINGDYPGYNPFAIGSPSELADKIMALMDYSEEHYEKNAQTFVQILVYGLQSNGIPMTFENIVRHFSKNGVKALLSPTSSLGVIQSDDLLAPIPAADQRAGEYSHYLTLLEQLDKRAIEGLIARLGTLAREIPGTL